MRGAAMEARGRTIAMEVGVRDPASKLMKWHHSRMAKMTVESLVSERT
jgi:hypothetical protein